MITPKVMGFFPSLRTEGGVAKEQAHMCQFPPRLIALKEMLDPFGHFRYYHCSLIHLHQYLAPTLRNGNSK